MELAQSGRSEKDHLGFGACVYVALQIDQRHRADREAFAQYPGEVAEVAAETAEDLKLKRAVGLRVEVPIAEIGEGWLRLWSGDPRSGDGGRPVVSEERHDVGNRRHLDEPLLEPHESVVDLRRLRLRFRLRLGDLAEREHPLLTPIVEDDPIAADSLLERGYAAPFPTMPPQCDAGILTKLLPDRGTASRPFRCKPNDAIEMREEGFEPSRLAAQEPKSCVSAVPPLSRFDGFRFYSGPPDRSIVGSEVAGLPSSDRPVGGRLAGVDGLGPWSEVPWRDDAT